MAAPGRFTVAAASALSMCAGACGEDAQGGPSPAPTSQSGAGGIFAGTGGSSNGGIVGQGGTTTGGSTGTGGTPGPASCPPPPAGASPAQVTAINAVNAARLAAGSVCATEIAEINTASQAHCDYYAANSGNCTADAHSEVQGCTGFTGASFGDRTQAAGYTGPAAFEVMAFSNDPTRAVAQWLNSVWHRLPVLNPWVNELGYGGANRCDTIDFGRGTPGPDDIVVVYPYNGQTGVPTSFDGSHEGPVPPAPSTGWPSGSPITVYAKSIALTSHTVTVDGDTTDMPQVYLTSADSGFLRDDIMIYTNAPFASGTTYRVTIAGTGFNGQSINRSWTFTTR